MGEISASMMDVVRRAAEAFRSAMPLKAGALQSCAGVFLGEFSQAVQDRRETEQRWLNDLRQTKGKYEPAEEAKMSGRSKAFVKKTRSKVRSVDARMMDLVFPSSKPRTFEIKPTPEPRLAPKVVAAIKATLIQANNGAEPDPEAMKKAVMAFAQESSGKMVTRVDDQLAEIGYKKHVRRVLRSGHVYGTGILKGPLVERRDKVGYAADAASGAWNIVREQSYLPFVDSPPIWRCYPDMEATEIGMCRYFFEDHVFGKGELLRLAGHSGFDGKVIREYVAGNAMGRLDQRDYQNELRNAGLRMNSPRKLGGYLYTVLERWGWIEHDHAIELGLRPADAEDTGPVFGNVWMFPDGQVIKCVAAPIPGVEWIYHFYYFDKDESSIFGEGIPAVMRDDQKNLNAATRALLDNAAVTAGPQFEVYKSLLAEGEDHTDIRSFRVWLRTSGDPQYPAIRQLNTNSHLPELSGIASMFDNHADESTAIPKFWYGENPTNGAAGTASGLSMLMSNANIALKDQVVTFDDGITTPFITALYRWNMKFSRDDAIKGDYDVVATGAASLVAKEIHGTMLAQFAATLQPEERGYIKWDELVRKRAIATDAEEIVLSKDEADERANSPEGQMQQKVAQLTQQLAVEKLGAEVANLRAQAVDREAAALNKKVDAIYAAMQAAGIAVSNAAVTPAGDSILRAAGWQDAVPAVPEGAQPAQGQPAAAPGQPLPPGAPAPAEAVPAMAIPADANTGQNGGIETPALGAGQ